MSDTEILPPLLFPPKTARERALIAKLVREGRIRKIGPRLYTSVPASKVARAVRDSWPTIVSRLYPRSLLSHRSALEYKPSSEGLLILTASTSRQVVFPGLTLQFVRGPGPRKDDPKFLDLHASSLSRAFLENLSTTHRDAVPKKLSQLDLEQRLESILVAKGERALNEIRDHAKSIAKSFAWHREFEHLNKLIGGLLGTKNAEVLQSNQAKARAESMPYDLDATRRLQLLFAELRHLPFASLKEPSQKPTHFKNKAFFEAYFSNYIEGTTFGIEEAEEIVFDKKIPKNRPVDAHDVMSTFKLVSDSGEMRKGPHDFSSFIDLLKKRHLKLMVQRPDVLPGVFKTEPNRAGNTAFVHPDYVAGTLQKGYQLYCDLPQGMPRAIFMMFLVAEVHPFVDGNGCIARIMMNAELVSSGLATIIIPTVYRDDYLSALRAFSRRDRPQPLVKMLTAAQAFSCLDFSDYRGSLKSITDRQWLLEPEDGEIIL